MIKTATPELLDVTQCSSPLGLSERWVYEMFCQGNLRGTAKVGGRWRIDRAKVPNWIAGGGELAESAKPAESE